MSVRHTASGPRGFYSDEGNAAAARTASWRRVVVASDPSRRVMPGDGYRSFPPTFARRRCHSTASTTSTERFQAPAGASSLCLEFVRRGTREEGRDLIDPSGRSASWAVGRLGTESSQGGVKRLVRPVLELICRPSSQGPRRGVPFAPMPLGFRKSRRLAPGVRLNIGKRSAGLSVGRRGARVSASTSGRRGAWFSWRGLYWRRRL
jgi:hypothetical protein